MFILDFFRDFFSGIIYWLYLLVCIFAFFYVLGIVADRKRQEIANKLKEKKAYDIESGREAQIAAMETKQVLDVDEEPTMGIADAAPVENTQLQSNNTFTQAVPEIGKSKEDEVPQVMVLNSSETTPTEPAKSEPVVISSTPTVTPVQK